MATTCKSLLRSNAKGTIKGHLQRLRKEKGEKRRQKRGVGKEEQRVEERAMIDNLKLRKQGGDETERDTAVPKQAAISDR